MTPEQRLQEAERLAGLWSRISRQHLSSGQGCACGFGGGLILQGASFELDIIEFLLAEAQSARHDEVTHFVESVSRLGPDRYSLTALLEAAGSANNALSTKPEYLAFILEKIAQVLSAIDEAHGRRFACD